MLDSIRPERAGRSFFDLVGYENERAPRRAATDAGQELENFLSEAPRAEQPEMYWAAPANVEKYPILAQAALTIYSVPGNGDVVCETSFSRLTLTVTPLRRSMLAATVERKTLLALKYEFGWWTPNPDLKDDPKMIEILKSVASRGGVSRKRARGEPNGSAAHKEEEEEARQFAALAKAAREKVVGDLMDEEDEEKEEGEI